MSDPPPRKKRTKAGRLPVFDIKWVTHMNELLWQQDYGETLAQVVDCSPFYCIQPGKKLFSTLQNRRTTYLMLGGFTQLTLTLARLPERNDRS